MQEWMRGGPLQTISLILLDVQLAIILFAQAKRGLPAALAFYARVRGFVRDHWPRVRALLERRKRLSSVTDASFVWSEKVDP